jgi:hypothetical protein
METLLSVVLTAATLAQPPTATRGVTVALSSVSGRVTDSSGEPVAGARVRSGLRADRNGRAVFVMHRLPRGWVVTDADGRYRLDSVPSGEAVILVTVPRTPPGADARFRLRDAFHPGAAGLDEATPIQLEPGVHHPGVDVVVPRTELYAVEVVLGAAAGAHDVRVVLVAAAGDVVRNLPWSPDGAGGPGQPRLPAGRYLVRATGRDTDGIRAAWQEVHLQGDVQLHLDLEPAGRIHGRVVAERAGVPPAAATQVVADLLLDGRAVDPLAPDRTDVGPDGRFAIEGLFGSRRLRMIGLPDGWQVIAVRHEGSDRTESGIDVGPGQTVLDVEIVIGLR